MAIDFNDITINVNGKVNSASNKRCDTNSKEDGFIYNSILKENDSNGYDYVTTVSPYLDSISEDSSVLGPKTYRETNNDITNNGEFNEGNSENGDTTNGLLIKTWARKVTEDGSLKKETAYSTTKPASATTINTEAGEEDWTNDDNASISLIDYSIEKNTSIKSTLTIRNLKKS